MLVLRRLAQSRCGIRKKARQTVSTTPDVDPVLDVSLPGTMDIELSKGRSKLPTWDFPP